MTLKVNGKTYEVELNGTDYVTQTEPKAEDFPDVFTADVDGETQENMKLAGIQKLEDGWHISLYQMSPQEVREIEREEEITSLQEALAEVYELII